MQTTSNLALKKIELTDSPPDITVQDDNWNAIDKHLFSAVNYQKAGGTGTALTLNEVTLVDGYCKTFIATANNGGEVTTINAKQLYKPGTTAAPTLISGKAYTVWYDATGDCFFIKASAEGNANAADVLAGKTFSNGEDTGILGTMLNRGAMAITPSTVQQAIPNGYHNGSGYVVGDADLVPSSIVKDKTIFGVTGITEPKISIVGETEVTGIYNKEAIKMGDLVVNRRYFGFDTPVKCANPISLPSGNVSCIECSPDGVYVFVGVSNDYNRIYKRSGDTLTFLCTIDNSVKSAFCASWSADSTYIAFGTNWISPYLFIYKRTGDTFTKLANPNYTPASYVSALKFSPDGNHLVCSEYQNSPYIHYYNRTGDTFSQVMPLGGNPTAYSEESLSWSYDGQYFAFGMANGYIYVYKVTDGTPSKVAEISTGMSIQGLAFSPSGPYLAVATNSSPFIIIYKQSESTFTKLADPAITPSGGSLTCEWSADGDYLAFGLNTSPHFNLYKRSGDTFTKLANLSTNLGAMVGDISFSKVSAHMFLCNAVSPYMYMFKADLLGDFIQKYVSLSDLDYGNYLGFGYAKTTGAINVANSMIKIPIK